MSKCTCGTSCEEYKLRVATEALVGNLRYEISDLKMQLEKIHRIAWPQGGDLNGDPVSDIHLFVGSLRAAAKEAINRLQEDLDRANRIIARMARNDQSSS